MTTGRSTVVGVFDERSAAERAIEALYNAGFQGDQIRFSGSGGNTGTGFVASLKNLFSGDDASRNSSAVANDLTHMGLSRDESSYYAQEYENGRSIVAVSAQGREQDALTILRTNSGYDYSSRTNTTGRATTGTATTGTAYTNTARTTADATLDADQQRSLKLREEQLIAEKQRVQSGEARLRKEVVEQQQSIDVPLTHEEVIVEKHAYTNPRPSDTPIGQDETIRVPVSEEQVNVTKQTVTTGEVSIGKRSVQENQRVTDTVKHEEAYLDREGNARVRTNDNLADDTLTDEERRRRNKDLNR